MFKTNKRIISIVLSICLLLSICVPAYASGAAAADAGLQEHMLRLLASVEPEPEYYGLNSVDFGAVPIGREIPAYQVVDGGNLIQAGVRLIPIVKDGRPVSLFTIFKTSDGEIHAQLGSGLAESINKYLGAGDSFAVIYDDEGAYLYSEGALTLLGCSGRDAEDHNFASSLSDSELDRIETCAAVQQYTLDAIEYMAGLPAAQAANPAAYLPVEIVRQPDGSMICWAAASASIINYIKGTHYTAQQVANKFGTNQAMEIHNVIFGLNTYYGLNYAYKNGGTIDGSFVLGKLAGGKPLYGDFWDFTFHHAVVIRGVNTLTNSFSVMDPESSTYTAGTYSSNCWSFDASYDKTTWRLTGYGYYNG